MTPDQIFAMVAALLSAEPDASQFPVVAAGGADSRYEVAAAPCSRPISGNGQVEIEGETVICGTVSVPFDHGALFGRDIDLSFVIYKSRSLAPASDAVVYLHGGPGGGTVEAVSFISLVFEELRRRRDVVVFDQRGADASRDSISCFRTVSENYEFISDALYGVAVPNLANDLTADCLAEIAATGTDVSLINTYQNARDVQAVMRALGYPEYNIYGISYGTKLALEVMRSVPEGVRSVVLDSVASPHIPLYDTLLVPFAESFHAVFEQCAADDACNTAFPNLREDTWALLDRLYDDPMPFLGTEITAYDLFDLFAMRNAWHVPRGLTAYLPLVVGELTAGDTTTFEAIWYGSLPPARTVSSVLDEASPDITPNELALAFAILREAEEIGYALETISEIGMQLESGAAAVRSGATLAAIFDQELTEAKDELPSYESQVDLFEDYLALRGVAPSAEALRELVATHFPPETATRLTSFIDLMNEADIIETFRLVTADNEDLIQVLRADFELMIYACQEDMDDNSPQGQVAIHAELDFPERIEAEFEFLMASFYENCALFENHPRPGFHDPVTSEIPTLVFSGMLDTQTAASWGPETARHLPNATALVMPETGHGAIMFSQCARDLGVAFIEDPTAALDTSCVDGLRPDFKVPRGTFTMTTR